MLIICLKVCIIKHPADSTFYPNNTGCVGLFGTPEQSGISSLSIEATVTVEILGTAISFDLPYEGGVMLLDLVFSDGDYTSLNNFIPTFVIEVDEASDPSDDIYGCTDELALIMTLMLLLMMNLVFILFTDVQMNKQ